MIGDDKNNLAYPMPPQDQRDPRTWQLKCTDEQKKVRRLEAEVKAFESVLDMKPGDEMPEAARWLWNKMKAQRAANRVLQEKIEEMKRQNRQFSERRMSAFLKLLGRR